MSEQSAPVELGTLPTSPEPPSDRAPLIATKTQIPRRRTDTLPRGRLSSFLHAHLDRKLILISAPAGYGKTTLLTEFANDTDLPVCWLTLDPFDRDLHVFLHYLISAIARRFPAFGQRSRTVIQETANPYSNLYTIVATVVQEIYDTIPEYFVLILDDHHSVENQEQINEFLDLFVAYADENCHLILASRTLPALPNLSLLVARRQAAGLSIDELRFTPQEIQALARQSHGIELTTAQADLLVQRTGGWITGILLTAVPRWEESQSDFPMRGRIGVDLYDYLSNQVLERQPAPLRGFLLASSVLDEMSPELCADVLGLSNPMDLLNQVRTRNLFVIEFEGDVSRLRYHDLFHEFLRDSLERRDKARFRELTRRAARAYAETGEWERAVSRYTLLDEYEQVADVIEQATPHLSDVGRWDTLAGWIDSLPEEIQATRPHLWTQRAQIHIEQGEHEAGRMLLRRAQRAFMATGNWIGVARASVLQSSILRFQGQYEEAIELCLEALGQAEGRTSQAKLVAALAHKTIGLCQLRLGRLAAGQEALHTSLGLYDELNAAYNVGTVHHDLGLSHELAGNLSKAIEHYQCALQYWEEVGALSPWANTLNGLGVVYYLQGNYEAAQPTLNEALAKAQQAGDRRVEAFAWSSLGDLHRDLGALKRSEQAFLQALEVAERTRSGFIFTYALNGLGNVLCQLGDLIGARRELERAMGLAEEHRSTYEIGLCHTSLGTLAMEEGDLVAARCRLDRACSLFEAGGFQQELSRACLHRARAAFLASDREVALLDLAQSLDLADQLGVDQFLVIQGQRLLPLFEYALERGATSGAIPDLLARIKDHQAWISGHPEALTLPAEPETVLRIRALGQPQVWVDGQLAQWTLTKSRDLFFYLLQHREGLRKEQIGEAFWPEHAPDKMNSAFRSTLYRLRRILYKGSVLFEEGSYTFDWNSNYWLDVEEFDRLIERAEQSTARNETTTLLEEALSLYGGDYLDGTYYEWAEQERQRLQERYLAAMQKLGEVYTEQGWLQRAIGMYQRILAVDPHQEVVHRALMRCHHQRGDRAAAIRQYRACVDSLREDLGLSPTGETDALYLKIIE